MAFLLEGLFTAGAIYETGKEIYNESKGLIYFADNVINKFLDIGEGIILNLDNNNKKEITDIDYTPSFKSIYTGAQRIAARLIPKYGLYGGPNYTGGRSDNITINDFYIKPVDRLDALCRNHDFHYSLINIPRNQLLGDMILISGAESLLNDDEFKNNDYLKALISLFKKKIFLDISDYGSYQNIPLPSVDDYINKTGVYNENLQGVDKVNLNQSVNQVNQVNPNDTNNTNNQTSLLIS